MEYTNKEVATCVREKQNKRHAKNRKAYRERLKQQQSATQREEAKAKYAAYRRLYRARKKAEQAQRKQHTITAHFIGEQHILLIKAEQAQQKQHTVTAHFIGEQHILLTRSPSTSTAETTLTAASNNEIKYHANIKNITKDYLETLINTSETVTTAFESGNRKKHVQCQQAYRERLKQRQSATQREEARAKNAAYRRLYRARKKAERAQQKQQTMTLNVTEQQPNVIVSSIQHTIMSNFIKKIMQVQSATVQNVT
jgi:hypothetical protein